MVSGSHVVVVVGLFLSQIPKALFATWGVGYSSQAPFASSYCWLFWVKVMGLNSRSWEVLGNAGVGIMGLKFAAVGK